MEIVTRDPRISEKWGYRVFSYVNNGIEKPLQNQGVREDMSMYEKVKWCPGEDSNLHVHTDTST